MKNFNIFFTSMCFGNIRWQKIDTLNAEGKIRGFSGALWREKIFGENVLFFWFFFVFLVLGVIFFVGGGIFSCRRWENFRISDGFLGLRADYFGFRMGFSLKTGRFFVIRGCRF